MTDQLDSLAFYIQPKVDNFHSWRLTRIAHPSSFPWSWPLFQRVSLVICKTRLASLTTPSNPATNSWSMVHIRFIMRNQKCFILVVLLTLSWIFECLHASLWLSRCSKFAVIAVCIFWLLSKHVLNCTTGGINTNHHHEIYEEPSALACEILHLLWSELSPFKSCTHVLSHEEPQRVKCKVFVLGKNWNHLSHIVYCMTGGINTNCHHDLCRESCLRRQWILHLLQAQWSSSSFVPMFSAMKIVRRLLCIQITC